MLPRHLLHLTDELDQCYTQTILRKEMARMKQVFVIGLCSASRRPNISGGLFSPRAAPSAH